MTRVVLDTNVFISAFEFGGAPRTALLLGSAGFFALFISAPMLDELIGVLRDRFGYSDDRLRQIELRVSRMCTVTVPTEELAACSDPDDNRILECAVAANIREEPWATEADERP